MPAFSLRGACLGLALAGSLLAQPAVGKLLYATPAGRAISLTVVDGGHAAFITLKPEQGDAERFRVFLHKNKTPNPT